METINLGKTDLKISRLGIGTWAIGGFGWGRINDDDSVAALRRAWDSGINFFDTADIYGFGHAEEILALALGENRKKAVIATKFGVRAGKDGKTFKDISPQYVRAALENSLRRLKIDCVPLYQIHWPDGVTSVAQTMEVLQDCQREGKIKHIGYSNFSSELVRAAETAGRGESLQLPYNLIDHKAGDELMPFCAERQITMISYGSLAQGLLSGKFGKDSKFDENDIRNRYPEWQGQRFANNLRLVDNLKQIAAKYGKTTSQAAIRWILDRNVSGAALVGVTHPDQTVENAGALDWHLSGEDIKLLSSNN